MQRSAPPSAPPPLAAFAALTLVGACVLQNPDFGEVGGEGSESASGSTSGTSDATATSDTTTTTSGSASGSAGESAATTQAGTQGGPTTTADDSAGESETAAPTCADLECGANATCDDGEGGPTCTCDPGFTSEGELCADIDECAGEGEGAACAAGICVNSPGSFECVYPATCAALKTLLPVQGDGQATLYVGGDPQKPWEAYCHEMAGTPREYLTLPEQSNLSNRSRYSSPNGNPNHKGDVTTRYQRIRIDPSDLRVDIGDATFASSEGSATWGGNSVHSVGYGVAATCDYSLTTAVIDLRGTPFDANVGSMCTHILGGTTKIEARVLTNEGGGGCGWRAPGVDKCPFNPINGDGGKRLQLIYVP